MITKVFVLHSGGLDSSVCLAEAVDTYGPKHVVSIGIDYEQRHIKEAEYAQKLCRYYDVDRHVIKLGEQPASLLTDKTSKIPDISYEEIKGVSPTYHFFRNGQMLSAIAAFAHAKIEELDNKYGARYQGLIYWGAHAEDAANWAYPDCTPEFVGAMANAVYIGTYHKVRCHAPHLHRMKADIVARGWKLGMPFEYTWSCYKGEERHCGTCPTCLSRRKAFSQAFVTDPTEYAA